MSADDRKPLFVECMKCGERWKVATVPLSLDRLSQLTGRAMCPNCFEEKEIAMCPTDGPRAVTTARDGKAVPS